MSLVSHSFKVQGCVRDDKSLVLTITISNSPILKVHPKAIFHVTFDNPNNLSGVSQRERISPSGHLPSLRIPTSTPKKEQRNSDIF